VHQYSIFPELLSHESFSFGGDFIAITQDSANAPSLAVCRKGRRWKNLGNFWRNRLDWGLPGKFYYY
jgi:hypothetical protein